MGANFDFLKILAIIFKVLAWVAAGFFFIVSIIVLFGGASENTPRAVSVIFLLTGGFHFLVFYCISEVVKLLLDLLVKVDNLTNLLEKKAIN